MRRTVRTSQAVSLTWRRERETFLPDRGPSTPATDLGGLEAAWALSSVKQYPLSISPVDGGRLRVAVEKEDPALGSDFSLTKVTADARGYLRLGSGGIVLAARGQGGFTLGEQRFQRTFAVGGFPDNNLFDLQRTNLAVLRGYRDDAFTGRNFFGANLEARFPLGFLQRGWRTLPLFIRHFHGALFLDTGQRLERLPARRRRQDRARRLPGRRHLPRPPAAPHRRPGRGPRSRSGRGDERLLPPRPGVLSRSPGWTLPAECT